jgi:hypothetical protein
MATEIARSKLDEKMLLLAATHSPEEISRELGGVISPARVAANIEMLLQSHDWLTLAQQDALVTWKLGRILNKLEEQFMDLGNAKVQIQLLKILGDRVKQRHSASQQDLETYNQNVGRQLGHVVDLALTYMKGALREEVDPQRWDELVQDAMALAWQEIQSKQIEE